MIYGLDVRAPDRGAVLETKLRWTVPPPVGASWSCCRRGDIEMAEVYGIEWAGLDGDPDAWVRLSGSTRLVNHLIDKHGFRPVAT